MESISKTFYDVEHEGDISEIIEVITSNGGKVLSRDFNYDCECLQLTFEVPNRTTFFEAVKDEYFF